MFKRIKFIVLIFTYFNINIGQSAKYWNNDDDDYHTKEFLNPENWENKNPPCSMDTIIFPKEYPAMILTPPNGDLNIDGIVFPINGAIILNETKINTTISFTNNDPNNSIGRKCYNQNHLAKIKILPKIVKSWFDPKNWKTSKPTTTGHHHYQEKQNSATPHVERIPCSNEFAYIDIKNGPINIINMDNIDKLELGGFNMGGFNITSELFEQQLFTDLAHIIFENADDIQIRYLDKNYCGCHRPEMIIGYNTNVCKFIQNLCDINYPKCLEPIIPNGHCCKVCGSMVKIIIDDCRSFNLKHFKELIQNSINDYGMKNQLDFDATIINDGNNEQYIQLVILDRDNNYQEYSIDFMKHLNETILKKLYSRFEQKFHISGMAYDKKNTGSAYKYILVPLLAVIVFFIIIYVHFIPENPYIRLPPWLYSGRYNIFNTPFVFARFDNSQVDDINSIAEDISGGAGSSSANVVMKVGYEDLKSPDGNNDEENMNGASGRSFDNPMFSERNDETSSIEDFGTIEATELTEIRLDENLK